MTGQVAENQRVIEYPFKADCTLYLEEGRLIRKVVEGKWYSPHQHNDVEWQVQAEHALAWIVGTLHLHDPKVTSRVNKHTVQKWMRG